MKIALVCGGREFMDQQTVARFLGLCLDDLCPGAAGDSKRMSVGIVQGGADGADRLAKEWAIHNGIACAQVDANWDHFGPNAGRMRNSWMLALCKPDILIAFPGGRGTGHMISEAIRHRIPVRGLQYVYSPEGTTLEEFTRAAR